MPPPELSQLDPESGNAQAGNFWDPGVIRQRPRVPRSKAEHMAAPIHAAGVKKTRANPEPSTHGPGRESSSRPSLKSGFDGIIPAAASDVHLVSKVAAVPFQLRRLRATQRRSR
jgi:hypothetical protein